MSEVVSAHAMVVLEMSDDGLHRGPPAHFTFDLVGQPTLLSGGIDPETVGRRGVMAFVAGVAMMRVSVAPTPAFMAGMTVSSGFS